MLQECEYRDYIDVFYQGINKFRKEHGLDIFSEDQCIKNQLLEVILKGQLKEQEEKRMIYKNSDLFCQETNIIFCKQELKINTYSSNRSEVDEAIRYLFNQIFQDNKKEIQYNKKLTHMKMFILKTNADILKSCLVLSAKPLQIIEFSYDTVMESFIVCGRLNRAISQDPINLYAIKVIDQYNQKEVIIGPGRGQIDEKLNFTFKIPKALLKDTGIQPSNNRCELEFYHKSEAEISHYQHFAFKSVDIDHTFNLIMKQSFFPIQNGRFGANKVRNDSPDVRRSNSLYKNRLSSSCNKENRIQGQDIRHNSYSQNYFSQKRNHSFFYNSEKRNNNKQSPFMDPIWESNETDIQVQKDDIFRSGRRVDGNKNQKQLFSFGDSDIKYQKDTYNQKQQQQQATPFSKGGDTQLFKKDIFNNIISSQQPKQSLQQNDNLNNNRFQNTIFKQQLFSQEQKDIKSQSFSNNQPNYNSKGNISASDLFSNHSNSQNVNIFNTSSKQDQNIFSKNKNIQNDIWQTSEKDLFKYQGKSANKSLQHTNSLNTNIFQTNNMNNNNNNHASSITNTNNIGNNITQMINNNNNNTSKVINNNNNNNISNNMNSNFNNNINNTQFSFNQSAQPVPYVQQNVIKVDNQSIQQHSIQQTNMQNINQQSITSIPVQNNNSQLHKNSLIQNSQTHILPTQSLTTSTNNQMTIIQQNQMQSSQSNILQNQSLKLNTLNETNLFSESERLYFKGVKHTFTQYENLAKLPQEREHKIPSNKLRKQKVLLDSRGFKDANKKVQKLKQIEKGYKCCQDPLKSDYQKYWNTGEHCDFIVQLDSDSEAHFRLHKVVVGHYSEYFRKMFNEQKITHFTLKQNNFNGEAVRLMFKWMYFNELPNHEWDEMSFKQAQQSLNCALFTKTWEFLAQVILKVIIPKMTSDKLIDFMILSEYLPVYFQSRKDDEALSLLFGVLKLLQNYCVIYFSNNSIEVIEKTEDVKLQQLLELNSDLIFVLINETCLKFDTLEHLERLFGWINKQAPMHFGRNIIELCSFFESQYLDIQPFDQIYMPFDKEIKSLKSECAFTTPFYDKKANQNKEKPSNTTKNKQNDAMHDEQDTVHTEISDMFLTKKEWPSANLLKHSSKEEQTQQRDSIFSRNSDFVFQFKRPDIPTVFITEEFYSFSRKWRLILMIDNEEDQNISIFLRESGQRSQKQLDVNLYNERILFTSSLIRIQFQERKSCSFDLFYSYANNQNISVGREKFCQAKRIADPQTHNIKIKVWIEELQCHSGLMHFVSQKLNDFMVEGFNEEQMKSAQHEIEQSNKKRMVNNEPVSNQRQSQRIMDVLLNNEWSKITAQMDQEGKIISPIKSRMSINRDKERFQIKEKQLNIYSFPVFEAYYILSSDNLNINHENYTVHFIYRIALNKSDIEIDLLLHGIRFSYLDFEKILNLARDHNSIKGNKYFQMMVQKEVNLRFDQYQDKIVYFQKGRNNLDYAQFYKNQNKMDFKQSFLNWLFNSEHHQGFKNEIQKIQTTIKSQMETLQQKENEINKQFMKLKQEELNNKTKQIYPHHPNQIIPVISSISTNPSINSYQGGIDSQDNSFEDTLQRRNLVKPSHAQMEPRVIYNQNGQPILNIPQQEKQTNRSVMNYSNNINHPYLSSSRAIEKESCNIF